jgi:hypothetical protein
LFAVLRAGRPFPHYLLLFFLPVFGVVIAAAGMVGRAAWRMLSLGAVACLGVVAVVLLSRQGPVGSWIGGTQLQWRASVLSEPARVVVGLARSGDSMAVWGWEPSLYVQTGLPLGTRDSLTYGIMTPGRYQAYYLNRYATDLRKGRPRFFLDVVRNGAFAYGDRSSLGHERFPQIDEIVRSDYTFAGEFGTPGDGYRLYVLKESTPP